MVTDHYMKQHQQNVLLRGILGKVPEDALDEQELAMKQRLSSLPAITILQLVYQQTAYEGQAKDYEFSGTSMREHWQSGYRDTVRTLSKKDWLKLPEAQGGIVVHDVHRVDG
jgi:NTE family protein